MALMLSMPRLYNEGHIIPTITCQQLLCSWISRKSSTQHGTQAYYINCQKYNIWQFSLSWLPLVSHRKFEFLVEGKFSMPRKILARIPQSFILAPILYRERVCVHACARALCMQHLNTNIMFSAVNTWYESCNMKINEGKTQVICFSRRLRNAWQCTVIKQVYK
jgi:hypothetical protein